MCFWRFTTFAITSAIATSPAWRAKCPQTSSWTSGRAAPSPTWRTSPDPAPVCQSRWDEPPVIRPAAASGCLNIQHTCPKPQVDTFPSLYLRPPLCVPSERIVVTRARWMCHYSSGNTRHLWPAFTQHSRQLQRHRCANAHAHMHSHTHTRTRADCIPCVKKHGTVQGGCMKGNKDLRNVCICRKQHVHTA